jgi:hypothetical protein
MTSNKSFLSFVPERLPDQTLYSWTAMFHMLSGGSSVFETCKTLFGSSEAGRHLHIPSHLDSFCELTRSVLGSPEEVVSTATIIPFYTQFRHPRVASEILEKVRGARIAGVAQTLGVYAIGQHSFQQHKACVECVLEDANEFGFSYWHRAHQLPCTLVCHKHGTLLFGVAVEHRHSRRESFIFPTVDFSDSADLVEQRIRTNEHDLLSRMAEISLEIARFKQPLGWDRYRLKNTFLAMVRERNVWFGSTMLDPNKLELDFRHHFREVLEIVELADAIQKRGMYTVWCLIEGVERPVHPEDWVIAIEWIFGSWSEFMARYNSLKSTQLQ